MGAQSSMLALVGAAGVTASKMAQGISESNDGGKSKQMAQKARQNRDQMLEARKEQRDTLKKVEAASKGQNKDIKTQVLAKELMRM